MKKNALIKDFYREIIGSRGRFLSILFIVAIGVAFFSGIRSAEPDMRYSGDAYFDEKNLMDIKVISTLGLTEDDIYALEQVEGIKAVEAGYATDALCRVGDSQEVVHIASILPSMNMLQVSSGRMPSAQDECFVDEDFLKSNDYEVGDTVTFSSGTKDALTDVLKTDTYKIVGSGSSPCYISFQRGSSTIGTGTVSGFVYVPESSFDMDVYTELYAAVDGAKALTAFTSAYEDRVEVAVDEVESIRKVREEARTTEITEEAAGEMNDAKQELADAKSEAEGKLADAKTKLDDGTAKLNDGKAELSDAVQRIADSRTELANTQALLDQNAKDINAQVDILNGQIATLNEAKLQYEALAASGMADETVLAEAHARIVAGDAQIIAGQEQLEGAKSQIAAGQEQVNSGWAQIEQAQAELETAKNEIVENEKKLAEAQTEYDNAKKEADEKIADGEKEIRDAEEEISKIEHAKWYINDRSSLPEYSSYGENADRMKAIGQVFPVLFFLVAALISLTTMTRMVEEQRTQIGTLKALGYHRRSIAWKYLGYALLATVSGCVVGVLVGEKVLPYIIITAYRIMYQHMDIVRIPYNLFYATLATAAALTCTLLATVLACYGETRAQAAELMRPPAPKQGKRVFLERVPFIWKHLNFIWKATIRNLIRYKKRFFMTVFGIGGCMALLLVGFGLKDSIFDIAYLQYEKIQLYDGTIILNEDAGAAEQKEVYENVAKNELVQGTEKNLLQQVTVSAGKVKKDLFLNVPESVAGFADFVLFNDRVTGEVYQLDDKGVFLTEKIAKVLDVEAGDSIFIKDDVKGEIEVTVESICENYMSHYMYMTPGLYEELYGKAPEYNAVYFELKEFSQSNLEAVGKLALSFEGALNVSYTSDFQEQLDNMLGSLNIVLVVLVISAGMLAFVVLYNLNNINITERKRELATLKVLGFYDNEVSAYVYRENIILTLIGAGAGVVLGKLLHRFVVVTVEIDSAMFGRNIDLSSFIFSILITIGFSLFVNWVMYYKLKKINMVESLKSVE